MQFVARLSRFLQKNATVSLNWTKFCMACLPGSPTRWFMCIVKRLVSPTAALLASASLVMLLIAPIGCGGPQTDPSEKNFNGIGLHSTPPDLSAADYLKRVLSRYRNARSYRDLGEVRLRVEKNGRLTRQAAPMHVMLDGATIWIAAYDARLWSDDGKTIGWIAETKTNHHDSQVVVGDFSTINQSSGRPVLQNLLRDPILTQRMVSGLGGPPPQLEWLLDPDPMSKLFASRKSGNRKSSESDPAPIIEYDAVALRDQVECVVVKAIVGNDLYRFWIDRKRSLVHSVELPVSMAGQHVQLDGWKVHSLELVLVEASFQSPPQPFRLNEMPQFDFPSRPKYLRSLVPLPPQPDRRLGGQVGAFDATDVSGRIKLNHHGTGAALTLWYANLGQQSSQANTRNLQSINALSTAISQAGQQQSQQVGLVCMVDDDSGRFLVDAGIEKTDWALLLDGDSSILKRIGIEPGQAVLTDSGGHRIWIGDVSIAAEIEALSAVLADSLAGVDVAAQIRRQSEADQNAYLQKLSELTTDGPNIP